VRDILNAIVDRGASVAANRALARVRKLFNWLGDIDVLERSPCYWLPAPVAETSRDRVLSDAEIAAIWKGADACGYPYAPFVKLLVLLGQRRSEVAAMRWLQLDLASGLWTMPNRSTKNKGLFWKSCGRF
jgi:integrase